ncbi:MAG: acyltransferase family protein, partial [Fimbriiglobus sp.]
MRQFPTTADEYIPQLDGLRTLAVLAVMIHHWAPRTTAKLAFGPGGVQLFFVLSGFLITGILVRARDRAPTPAGRRFALRAFYARRFLRIFPLYYAVILAGCLADIPPFRSTVGWTATYLSNIYFFIRQEWHGPITHFWSLAVEEQFYLGWPLVVLFCPPARLKPVVYTAIAGSVVYQVVMATMLPEVKMARVIPVAALDALGGGALLAVLGAGTAAGARLAHWGR